MDQRKNSVSRRVLFAGAGTAGFLAVAAGLAAKAPSTMEAQTEVQPPPERGGGYRLSDHVKHYYRTTRL